MCGLGGIYRVWSPGAAPPPPEVSIPDVWFDSIEAAAAHRGPDGQGRFRDRALRADGSTVDIAMVHRRLSILDHAGGAQPMVVSGRGPTEDDTIAVVFNGFLANHGDIRRRLREEGHMFASDHSDTEALARAVLAWSDGAFCELNGMYSAAVWSRARATLLLARDMFGEKPMYITSLGPGIAAFANVPRALLELRRLVLSGERATAGPGARVIARGGVCWKDTFAGVGQIGPGEWVQAPPRGNAAECAWERDGFERTEWGGCGDAAMIARGPLDPGARPTPRDPEREIEELLSTAVQRRLDADVPVACLLSGGVDSSLVTLLAKRHAPGIVSLCVRMPSPEYDESAAAARIAELIGTRHVTVDVEADPAADTVRLIETLGFPLGDSSLLPTYWACKAARQHAKVVLTGDGGDEVFVGYERYMVDGPLRRLRWLRPLAGVLGRGLPQQDPKAMSTKAARLLRAAGGGGYADLVSVFSSDDLARLIPDGEVPESKSCADGRVRDLEDNLPNVLLRKTDHASMLAGVELRAPMLDRELAERVLAWPREVLTPGGRRKGLLRAIARKYLPADIIDRPKSGFAIPVGEWFRTDFGGMKALLLDMLGSADPFPATLLGAEINRRFVTTMLDEHMQRRRDHSQRLYMLMVLAIWCGQQRR